MIRSIRFFPLLPEGTDANAAIMNGSIFLAADVVCECGTDQPFSNRCVECGKALNE